MVPLTLCLFLALTLAAWAPGARAAVKPIGPTGDGIRAKPSFVVILTDDQDLLLNSTHPAYMPALNKYIVDQVRRGLQQTRGGGVGGAVIEPWSNLVPLLVTGHQVRLLLRLIARVLPKPSQPVGRHLRPQPQRDHQPCAVGSLRYVTHFG